MGAMSIRWACMSATPTLLKNERRHNPLRDQHRLQYHTCAMEGYAGESPPKAPDDVTKDRANSAWWKCKGRLKKLPQGCLRLQWALGNCMRHCAQEEDENDEEDTPPRCVG